MVKYRRLLPADSFALRCRRYSQRYEKRDNSTMNEPLLLTASEVGALLGLGRSTVWQHHSAGRLPLPVRIGRAVRWSRRELEDWIAAGAPARDRWEAMKHD